MSFAVSKISHSQYLAPLPAVLAQLLPGFSVPDPLEAPAVRWGVLGAGGIARTFVRAVQLYTSSQVLAVGSRDAVKARGFAADFDLPRAYGSYKDLLADADLDLIYVATPHNFHADAAIMAMQAGKGVLVEKAFTHRYDEAARVIDTAQSLGRTCQEAMWTRFLPGQMLLHALVKAGHLGDLVAAQADHGQKLEHVQRLVSPDLAGGALLDLGVYPVSWVQSFLGSPREVFTAGRQWETGVDVANALTLVYDRALGVATSNFDGRSATFASLTGTKASAFFAQQFYRPGPYTLDFHVDPGVSLAPGDPAASVADPTAPIGVKNALRVKVDAFVPEGFQYQIAATARAYSAGLPCTPEHTWEDTLQVMRTLDTALRVLNPQGF